MRLLGERVAIQTLSRAERLRGRNCFDALFARGNVGKGRWVLVRALANGLPISRLAAVAGKTAGNAVKRNRLRRRIRAAFRMAKETLPRGWDYAVVARSGADTAAFAALRDDLARAVLRAAGMDSR